MNVKLIEIATYDFKGRTEGRTIVLKGTAYRCVRCRQIFLSKQTGEKHECGISPHKLDK